MSIFCTLYAFIFCILLAMYFLQHFMFANLFLQLFYFAIFVSFCLQFICIFCANFCANFLQFIFLRPARLTKQTTLLLQFICNFFVQFFYAIFLLFNLYNFFICNLVSPFHLIFCHQSADMHLHQRHIMHATQ